MRTRHQGLNRLLAALSVAALIGGCGSIEQSEPLGTRGRANADGVSPNKLQTFGPGEFDRFVQKAAQTAPMLEMGGGGGGAVAAESITHVQEGGVDEGGIVKAHGDHLVVLRRGRLFSIGIDGSLEPTSYVNLNPDVHGYQVATTSGDRLNLRAEASTASAVLALLDEGTCLARDFDRNIAGSWIPVTYTRPSDYQTVEGWVSGEWITPADSCANSSVWYDEMLIHGDTIVVIGFDYGQQATEIGLFNIDAAGRITRAQNGRYFLRSNDYYSADNYASRLVDGKLVFHLPYSLLQPNPAYDYTSPGQAPWVQDDTLPALRAATGSWSELISKTEIYMPLTTVEMPVLHTVVTCDLDRPQLACSATGVVGAWSHDLYVSRDAVYLWVNDIGFFGHGEPTTAASLFRMPLGGGLPGAVRAAGHPENQFSFKQANGLLNVVVRAGQLSGDYTDIYAGDAQLLQIPLQSFGVNVGQIPSSNVRSIVGADQLSYSLENRFVGDWLLVSSPWGDNGQTVHLYNWVSHAEVRQLQLGHLVERIDVLGEGAIVVGSSQSNLGDTNIEDLGLSSIALGSSPRVVDTYVEPDALQGETRSHAYGYSDALRLVGLPIVGLGSAEQAGTARTLFLDVGTDLSLRRAGDLAADPRTASCADSCYDWYGNARPIFYDGRIFALMGYELVEGQAQQSGDQRWVQEIGRTAFSTLLP